MLMSKSTFCIAHSHKTSNALDALALREQECLQRLSVNVHRTFRTPNVFSE